MSPIVRFEPIGEEIECGEEETVLDAAFRHGYNLVYGCREGQCSACKSYLLEGEVTLRPYSTFALSDTEEAGGYTLLCRAMPDEDLTVELLHYDPDSYRLEHPIREGRTSVVAIESLTHDVIALRLRTEEPERLDFSPGQYVDLYVPGSEERRSFSMANLPGGRELEFLIRRYPDGRFSSALGESIVPGRELRFVGPYGAFHLRHNQRPILMIAGGTGMAPVLALLRQLASEGTERPVRFFYGARSERDLFHLETIEQLCADIGDCRFTPVLSDSAPEGWAGELGLVHEAVAGHLGEDELDGCEVYMCGPPAMIDAAIELLCDRHGVEEDLIHYDKFTTAAALGDAS